MFILKKGHQPGVYVPLRALFLVFDGIFTFYAGKEDNSISSDEFEIQQDTAELAALECLKKIP